MAKKPNKKNKQQAPKSGAIQPTGQIDKKNTKEAAPAPVIEADLFEELLKGKSLYVLLGLLGVLLLVLFGGFMFGDKLFLFKDIGSDTINVFYPQLVHISDYLAKDGLPKWSFNQGMGQNILPFSVGDPFNWILFLMGKDSLAYGIIYVEALKLLTAGLLFYAYLRTLNFNYHTAIVGAIFYAFCGFMSVGTGWYVFTTEGVYAALLLLGFERLFQKQSWWVFTLAIFLIGSTQVFNLYLFTLLLIGYGSLRIFATHGFDLKKWLGFNLQMAAWGTLGVLMSMGLLLSSVDQILNSPRVSGDSSFFASLAGKSMFAMGDLKQNVTIIGRLFSNDFLGDATQFTGWYNYLEAPMIYSGLALLLLLPQAFVFATGRKRILYAAALGIVILCLCFPFLRYTFWLYAGDYYRMFSLFVVICFQLLGLKVLNDLYEDKKVNIFLLIGTAFFLIVLMFAPFSNLDPAKMGGSVVKVDASLRNILVIFLIAYTAIIAAMQAIQYRFMARIAFVALVCFEVIFLTGQTYNSKRPVITKKEFTEKVGYNDYTVDAVALLNQKDPGFYRISKNYNSGVAMHSSTNDSKVQGFFDTKSYHSFNQKNYIRFLSELAVIDAKDENQTRWTPGLSGRQLLNMLASNKYILQKPVPAQPGPHTPFPMPQFGYTAIDSVGDVQILLNQNYLPFGFTYDKVLDEETFLKLPQVQEAMKKDIALFKTAVVSAADKAAGFAKYPTFDTILINPNYSLDELALDVSALKAEHLQIAKFSQNRIEGTIECSSPKMLFLSIPFDPGWSATVDGKNVPLYRMNVGFMGLPLEAGKHEVVLSFTPPYFGLSWMLSLLGFVAFAGLLWFTNRNKSKTSVETEEKQAKEEEIISE